MAAKQVNKIASGFFISYNLICNKVVKYLVTFCIVQRRLRRSPISHVLVLMWIAMQILALLAGTMILILINQPGQQSSLKMTLGTAFCSNLTHSQV